MNKFIKKDNINRIQFKKKEKEILMFKYLHNNLNLSNYLRNLAFNELDSLKIYKSRINNRCFITGRSRSVYSPYGISRITFRKLASNGLLKNIRKSSW